MAQAKNFPKLEAKQFAIALCSVGVWGIITSEKPEELTFKDGSKSVCHTGFTCRDTVVAGFGMYEGKTFIKKKGDSWASKKPQVVAYLYCVNPDTPIEDLIEYARRKLSALNL